MDRDTLLTYPDFNEAFKIHTDASAFQLIAVINQQVKTINIYSIKLTDAQHWYTVTDKELPIIVETLKEFRTILLGQKLIIYTDHKNLTCENFNTNRVLRWRIIIEDRVPYIEYVKGEKNIVSDALSILPLDRNKETTHKSIYQKEIVS